MSHVENAAKRIMGPLTPANDNTLKASVSRTIILPKNNEGAAVIAPNISAIQKKSSRSNFAPNTNKAMKNWIIKVKYLKKESPSNLARRVFETRIKLRSWKNLKGILDKTLSPKK